MASSLQLFREILATMEKQQVEEQTHDQANRVPTDGMISAMDMLWVLKWHMGMQGFFDLYMAAVNAGIREGVVSGVDSERRSVGYFADGCTPQQDAPVLKV